VVDSMKEEVSSDRHAIIWHLPVLSRSKPYSSRASSRGAY
jgi:hypothetical protein